MNHTLNATNATALINETARRGGLDAVTQVFGLLIPLIVERFWIFLSAPFRYLDMWWLLVHLILTFVLFEFYFERHFKEDLGWSAALANSIVMVFISMELIRSIYHHQGTPIDVLAWIMKDYAVLGFFDEQMKIISLSLVLGGIGLGTAFINYYHVVPRKLAFLISGHKTVNLLAYFLIVVVWRFNNGDPMPIDFATITALVFFGLLLWAVLYTVNRRKKKKRLHKKRTGFFR